MKKWIELYTFENWNKLISFGHCLHSPRSVWGRDIIFIRENKMWWLCIFSKYKRKRNKKNPDYLLKTMASI